MILDGLRWWMEDITKIANSYGLDPNVVAAVIWTESRGRADAFRFEPKFWDRYLKHHDLWKHQNPRRVSSSYGLVQILHVTAWEAGFRGEPEELFHIRTNIHWGCRHLKSLVTWAEGFQATPQEKLAATLAAYNGGRGGNTPGTSLRNQQYLSRVLAALAQLRSPTPAAPIHT